MRDADDASDVYRHRKNNATNKLARKLYLAAAVLFMIEVAGFVLSGVV